MMPHRAVFITGGKRGGIFGPLVLILKEKIQLWEKKGDFNNPRQTLRAEPETGA